MRFLIADSFTASLIRLYGDLLRTFDKPKSDRIAVKAINRLSVEVMKVFGVGDV